MITASGSTSGWPFSERFISMPFPASQLVASFPHVPAFFHFPSSSLITVVNCTSPHYVAVYHLAWSGKQKPAHCKPDRLLTVTASNSLGRVAVQRAALAAAAAASITEASGAIATTQDTPAWVSLLPMPLRSSQLCSTADENAYHAPMTPVHIWSAYNQRCLCRSPMPAQPVLSRLLS